MQTVLVEHDFTQPRERVFAYLAEHENLEALFGFKIRRICDGKDGTRNGVGSSRQLSKPPLPAFEETTTEVVPNEKIVYKITKGSPLKGHVGEMRFHDTADGGTHLRYEIRFGSKIPGVDRIVAKGLQGGIKKGLNKVGPTI